MIQNSTSLYSTFGNEIKYKITQDTLVAYFENATIQFPLPEASADLLADLSTLDSAINPQELDAVTAKLEKIGFQSVKAKTMASILMNVAKSQGVSPMEYFSINEASLKLAVDTYKTINLMRPAGNRIGLSTPIKNSRTKYSKLIKP